MSISLTTSGKAKLAEKALSSLEGTNISPSVVFDATGGTEIVLNGYKSHTFTSSGTFSVSTTGSNANVRMLIVAGGGGAGNRCAGGGGAGGVIWRDGNVTMSAASYTVTVGGGGTGGPNVASYVATAGTSGSNSSVIGTGVSLTAVGGGGGAANGSGGEKPATPGGSGGGGTSNATNDGISYGAAGTTGQGYAGGTSTVGITSDVNGYAGSGGGGASAVGGNNIVASSYRYGGHGGAGISNSITGSAVNYAGGGGGGAGPACNAGNGGTGGGGKGAFGWNDGTSGTANTGGGGGGGGGTNVGSGQNGAGGNGGSGIVIIAYPHTANVTNNAIGFTVSNVTANTSIKKFGAASGFFSSGTSYLQQSSGGTDYWPSGTGDFTVEWWQYIPAGVTGGVMEFLSNENTSGGFGMRFGASYNSPSFNHISIYARGTADLSLANVTWTRDTWQYVSATRRSGNIYYHVDGVLQTTVNGPQGSAGSRNFAPTLNNTSVRIGAVTGSSEGLRGVYIDDLRISASTARYTNSNYAVPDREAELETGTTLLLNMNAGTFPNRVSN